MMSEIRSGTGRAKTRAPTPRSDSHNTALPFVSPRRPGDADADQTTSRYVS